MAITPAGLSLAAMAIAYLLSPPQSSEIGKLVESESYTGPERLARCISYNINRKKPHLVVRNPQADNSDGSRFLVVTNRNEASSTYAVIRIRPVESGSRLTTWLPQKTLGDPSPAEVARILIAGC